MITFIVVTLLNTAHGSQSTTSIRARDITALRLPQSGIGCAVNHRMLEEEILVKESCDIIRAQLNAKPAPRGQVKKNAKAVQWSKS